LNKLGNGTPRGFETALCSPLTVLEKIFEEFAIKQVFGLSITLK
jgi:hypothetical protein